MQLGFVIDHTRCIGCHACTVACKAENDVPVGSFRTWVKYTEQGSFPTVRRSFAVLRCNQCTHAPCIEICPVRALDKRPDGIVDVDPTACIGCKACLQGCPYDALYINEDSGTAEKCHFCAHRSERGLAPACAVVCPTEAIIPGDFHDPESLVWRIRADNGVQARKVEAGTGPNVFYREVAQAGIDPLVTSAAGGYLWAGRAAGAPVEAERFLAADAAAPDLARTTYDVDHAPAWGGKVTGYLFAKTFAAGLFLALALLGTPLAGGMALSTGAARTLILGSLGFLALTAGLLVADLRRPERFLLILRRPNRRSWLARGSAVLMAYGIVLLLALAFGSNVARGGIAALLLLPAGAILAALTAAYTAWLFRQAKGRVLWMRRALAPHLVVQALAAGSATSLLLAHPLNLAERQVAALRWGLFASLAGLALFAAIESRLAPRGREREYDRAVRLVTHGPWALRHWSVGVAAGLALPLLLLATPALAAWWVAAALALVGIWVEEDVLIRAGQALPIS